MFLHTNTFNMHLNVFYLFIVIFVTAEFQIILKHSEKNKERTKQNYTSWIKVI